MGGGCWWTSSGGARSPSGGLAGWGVVWARRGEVEGRREPPRGPFLVRSSPTARGRLMVAGRRGGTGRGRGTAVMIGGARVITGPNHS